MKDITKKGKLKQFEILSMDQDQVRQNHHCQNFQKKQGGVGLNVERGIAHTNNDYPALPNQLSTDVLYQTGDEIESVSKENIDVGGTNAIHSNATVVHAACS